jgi:hypothetical protein
MAGRPAVVGGDDDPLLPGGRRSRNRTPLFAPPTPGAAASGSTVGTDTSAASQGGQSLGHRRHGGVLHLVQRQAVRLEGSMATQVVHHLVALLARGSNEGSNMSLGPLSRPSFSW